MSWGAYITGEGGLLAQYDKIACGGIFGQNGSTFAQAQDRLFSWTAQIPKLRCSTQGVPD